MPDDASKPTATGSQPPGAPTASAETTTPGDAPTTAEDERGNDRLDRGIGDFVRRAVTAGVVAASRSKDDIVRVAATEMRGWLDHLNLNEEIAKALTKMVIEVKTEVRFRPNDEGKLVPEATNDVKLKTPR